MSAFFVWEDPVCLFVFSQINCSFQIFYSRGLPFTYTFLHFTSIHPVRYTFLNLMPVISEDTEFNNDATILLIKFIRRRYNELQYQRTRPQVYRDVYEELCKHGYNFSVERIRRKWNNLLGSYKRVKKLKKTRKLQWEYYQV